MPRAEGPFRIIGQLNDNAYKVDLLGDYGVFATFDVANLSPYLDDNYLENLRANSSSQGVNDGSPSLLASTSPNKSKSKLMHFIFQALKTHMAERATIRSWHTTRPYCILSARLTNNLVLGCLCPSPVASNL